MAQGRQADHGLNRRHFQRFLLAQWRQQAGQAAGEQGLAGAGRPAEQQVVGARCRNQQRALGSQLALNFAQVRVWLVQVQQAIGLVGFNRLVPVQVRHDLQQVIHRNHLQARRQARFLGIRPGHYDGAPGLARRQCRWQYTLHRAHLAGQRQFAQAFHFIEHQRRHLHTGGQDAQGYRQIKTPAVLGQVGGREVEGDAPGRVLQSAIEDGAAYAVLAFLDGGFGQAHQGERRQAIGHMHFDGDRRGFDADLGAAVDDGEGHDRSLKWRGRFLRVFQG